nr:diguanylate cyclase [uncultured Acetobacterium sp.]
MGENFTLYDNLKSNKKLMVLIAVFMIGFILFAIVGYKTIANIKINGKMYDDIIRGKELVADVLPPPGYIIESYLLTLQLVNETDQTRIDELINNETQLKNNYLACHDKWENSLPEGNLKKNMGENAFKPAMAFFEVFENEFVPAIRNKDLITANSILEVKLEPLYLEHRRYIDEVVVLANAENSAIEESARKMVYVNVLILLILAMGVLATVIIFCAGIIRNEKLKKMSYFDELTGIANRRYFDQVLGQEISRAERTKLPLSLVIIDIDYYKEYNDTYGHLKGDECLRTVVGTLKKDLKRAGDFLARYGGDEFVVILPNTDDVGSASLSEKLRANIEGLRMEHVNSLCSEYVTLSIGVATTLMKANYLPDDLIAAADKALYLSKDKGRNQVSIVCLK